MIDIRTFEDPEELGLHAGKFGADLIKKTVREKGEANVILATGKSQFATLKSLIADREIPWSKVRMFHLDEYIGLPVEHEASFRKYLTERFVNKVGQLAEVVLIDGETDPEKECLRLEKKIKDHPIDLAFVGIGENGHLAFNDPPADFEVDRAYLVVNLDIACRQQQMGEGWFGSVEDVPKQAISMSIRQIMRSKHIIASVPDKRKASAVKNCLTLPVSNRHPASILQEHPHCTCFLDKGSASLLK